MAIMIWRIIVALAIASIILGSVSVYYGSSFIDLPALVNPPDPLSPNLTLDGALVGLFNASRLINQTSLLQCASNETVTNGNRLPNGLLLDGICTETPIGNATLPNITNFTNCDAVGAGFLTPESLWTDGRMSNGLCTPILTNITPTGGDFSGITTLLLNAIGTASSCGGAFLCEISIDAKGRTLLLQNGPQASLINSTGGGATGLFNNLSLSIIGTPNEVIVTHFASGIVQIAATQPICIDCSPSFAALTLTGTPLALSSGGTSLTLLPTNGQVLIGNGGVFNLGTLTGTANEISVTQGAGIITLALFQSLGALNSPTFASLTLTSPLSFANGGTGVTGTPTNGNLLIGNSGLFVLASLTGTANQITVTPGAGSITLLLPQQIGTVSTVLFGSLTLTTTPLARSSGGTGLTTAPANGQILMGTTATGNLILNTITGTANEIIVVNGAGSITLSTPQNIATTSSPTFGSLVLSGALGLGRASGGTGIKAVTTNGQVLLGIGGSSGYSLTSIAGTANQIVITPGAGTNTISLPNIITAGFCGGSLLHCTASVDIQGRVIDSRNDPPPIFATAISITTAGCFAFNASVYWMKTKVSTGTAGFYSVRMQISQTSSFSNTNTAGCSIQLNGAVPSNFTPNLPVVQPVSIVFDTAFFLSELRIDALGTDILITPILPRVGNGLAQGSSLQGYGATITNFQIGTISVLYITSEI
jgi:hypothetical protein